jgi:hypothetical protein
VENTEDASRSLDLPWGYRAERDGTAMRLVDPVGRRVTQFLTPLTLKDLREAGSRGQPEEAAITVEGWKGLCRLLLVRLFEQASECAQLREEIGDLDRQLQRVEEERDQANAVADDLYEYLREDMREVSEDKGTSKAAPAERTKDRTTPKKET